MGLLADAPPIEKSGFLVESQADLQDLHLHETQFEDTKEEAAACKGKGAIAQTDLSQCDLEHGFHARHAGKRQKGKKP